MDHQRAGYRRSRDRIYVAARGLYAVEEYLQARYYMFRQVYFHRTLRSAEAVLRSIFRRVRQLALAERRDGLVRRARPLKKWCGTNR